MKFALLTVLGCVLFNIACAQNDSRSKKFINEVVIINNAANHRLNDQHIVYVDSTTRFVISMMQQALADHRSTFYRYRQDSVFYTDASGKPQMMLMENAKRFGLTAFHKYAKEIAIDSLKLTFKEKAYIDDELSRMPRHAWRKGLFRSARLLPADSLNKIFKNPKAYGWGQINKAGIAKIFYFSKPIFLRNDSFCFFYSDYRCGGTCAYGEFNIYKKENGRWMRWFTLTSWIS